MSFHSKQIEFGILEDMARRIGERKSSGWSGSRNNLKLWSWSETFNRR